MLRADDLLRGQKTIDERLHLLRSPSGFGDGVGQRQSHRPAPRYPRRQRLLRGAGVQCFQKCSHLSGIAASPSRKRVEHHAAADRHHRRKLSQNKVISRPQQHGIGGAKLHEATLTGCELFLAAVVNDHRFSNRFRGVGVQMNARAVFQRSRVFQH